jgi:hypothetical protein
VSQDSGSATAQMMSPIRTAADGPWADTAQPPASAPTAMPAVTAEAGRMAARSWPGPARLTTQFLGEITGKLAAAGSVADPEALADRLELVFAGMNASAQALGADGPALQGRPLVELILADAVRTGG